ncbi:TrbI/VirB10 family protein [Bdellovibrionota bacterium FG-2]
MNEETEDVVIVPEKQTGALLTGLRAGDILVAEIEQSIKASPSVPTPIRARITQGRFRNTFVLGSATFDRELKRVLLVFDKLRLPGAEQSYQLKATGLALSGQVGLEGEHHTDEGVYFAAEVLTTTAAGYADATTSRNQNALGTYQTEPSLSNATKQGAVSALSKSAERFAERARSAPEYTEIEGGRAIQIIIETNPTEVSGS